MATRLPRGADRAVVYQTTTRSIRLATSQTHTPCDRKYPENMKTVCESAALFAKGEGVTQEDELDLENPAANLMALSSRAPSPAIDKSATTDIS